MGRKGKRGTPDKPLTDAAIKALKAGSGIRPDGIIGGLFLEVGKFKRTWRVQGTAYDVFQSDGDGGHEFAPRKTIRYTIGHWPEMMVDDARKAAIDALKLIKKGVNPKETEPGALYTLEDLYKINDVRLERDGADEVNRRNIMRNAKFHLDGWMDKALSDITKGMVREKHDAIAFDDGKPEAARHLFKEFTTAWNAARDLYDGLPECPVPRKRLYAKRKKGGAEGKPLHGDEWKVFWQEAARHEDPLKGLSQWFNLLSGTRPVNTADLRWEWCNLDAQQVNYPGEVMKNGDPFTLPLSVAMVAILDRARELVGSNPDGTPKHELVFYAKPAKPGHKRWREQPKRVRDPVTGAWTRQDRPLTGLVGHRLRHSHSNVCTSLGINGAMRNILHAQRVEGIAATYTSQLFQFPQLLETQERITAEILRRCGVDGYKRQ